MTKHENSGLFKVINNQGKIHRNLLNDKNKSLKDDIKKELHNMSPEEVFSVFDVEDSGLINYDTFRKLLPYVNIIISDAKAFKYFQVCNINNLGYIDIDEFRIVLYICNPTDGNKIGFIPYKKATSHDSFNLFDEQRSGLLDEDSFVFALEYLNIKIKDEDSEKYFQRYDKNKTNFIDYSAFREIFVAVCDVRAELDFRNVEIPSSASNQTLRSLLMNCIVDEDNKESLAIEEAIAHYKWLKLIKEKKRITEAAIQRSIVELRTAVDLGGQVYVFGEGSQKQFSSTVSNPNTADYTFEKFDKLINLWTDRVKPDIVYDRLYLQNKIKEREKEKEKNQKLRRGEAIIDSYENYNCVLDPFLEAKNSLFHNLNVATNTVGVWCRRIQSIAISESVIFALADTGEIYSWGGRSYTWHEIEADSIFQTKWRGDTTPRSQLLLGTCDKILSLSQEPNQATLFKGTRTSTDSFDIEEKKMEVIKVVTKYFNLWEPPISTHTRCQHFHNLLTKLVYDELQFSIKCRYGYYKVSPIVDIQAFLKGTKLDLVNKLYDAIIFEKELLGDKVHASIRELEIQALSLLKRHKEKLAKPIIIRIENLWNPLLELQTENNARKLQNEKINSHQQLMKYEDNYQAWRIKLDEGRADVFPEVTPRGNSFQIDIHGITPRANGMSTPRGYQHAMCIAAGSSHACLIHKTGQVYTWGTGISGRLGLDLSQGGNVQLDAKKPTVVQSLIGMPAVKVSCGNSHTGVVLTNGDLYIWGSCHEGKLGIGDEVRDIECYLSIPTKLVLDVKVKKISCGSSHSGIITKGGQVYMFGCGDGGRLGLGLGLFESRFEPTLATNLLHEKAISISCGNSTTIVLTEVKVESYEEGGTKLFRRVGGKVYVAGNRNVLGQDYDTFSLLKEIEHMNFKKISAGYRHQGLITCEGELYLWGYNFNGCCGVNSKESFVSIPTLVGCLFTKSSNLSLGKIAYQSSTFNSREANYAVNGVTSGLGLKECSCTQEEDQAWIEIDLGSECVIDEVRIFNRSDIPKQTSKTNNNLPVDYFTSRIFPFWCLIGKSPFDKATNPTSLKGNISQSVAKMKFSENKRLSLWKCPNNTIGRFVRIQLQEFSYLNLAEIEVYGWYRDRSIVGEVSSIECGRDVSVATINPSLNVNDFEIAYKRAIYADAANANIIRQFESYTFCFDKYGYGDSIRNNSSPETRLCNICKGDYKCEICILYETYSDEIEKIPIRNGRRDLISICEGLINLDKQEVPFLKDSMSISSINSNNVTNQNELPLLQDIHHDKSKKRITNLLNMKTWFKKTQELTITDAIKIDHKQLYDTITRERENLDDNKLVNIKSDHGFHSQLQLSSLNEIPNATQKSPFPRIFASLMNQYAEIPNVHQRKKSLLGLNKHKI